MFAINFTNPQARDDDTVAQANRSSTQDQLRELTAFIDGVKAKTGAAKVAIVALSRGGYSTRGYVAMIGRAAEHRLGNARRIGGNVDEGIGALEADHAAARSGQATGANGVGIQRSAAHAARHRTKSVRPYEPDVLVIRGV